MQSPTVGRIVHFFASGSTTPEVALVVAVHNDTSINASVCNSGGTWRTETSAVLGDPSDTSRPRWAWPARA